MVSYHELIRSFRTFGFRREFPVITHIGKNLSSKIQGGLSTFMGALLSSVDNILLPAFTYATMVVPQEGPTDNNMAYGNHDEQNALAAIYSHTLPSECGNQDAIDIVKGFPGVLRSSHPIFSFFGLGLDIALLHQTVEQPYYPIKKLAELGGWVLLADTGFSDNWSIHYAEMLAGRKQFMRWALTPRGVAVCDHFPGCSRGFHKLKYYLHGELFEHKIDQLNISAVPLSILIKTTTALLKEDPFALLCNDLHCAQCNLVRQEVKSQIADHWRSE